MDNTPQNMWQACMSIFQNNVSDMQFKTWFAPMKFRSYDADKKELRVFVPSQFFYEYMEEHFRRLLHMTFRRVFGVPVLLTYDVEVAAQETISVEGGRSIVAARPSPIEKNRAPKLTESATPASDLDSQLNMGQTFGNFIEGVSNKLPRAVGQAIAENPRQQTFNPLFIYGPSGVGKTHLLNAIGMRVKELHPQLRVLYLSAHLFKVQFQHASLNNRQTEFMHFYQSIDVLIIDDIQELIGNEKTQYAFFHIFNHLRQIGKQIILTSDRPPVALNGMQDRLITRFKSGLQAELERPEEELRRHILQSKIKRDGLCIPQDVIEYISENISDNVRELEGMVNSLMAYSVVYNKEVDLEFAQRIMKRGSQTVSKSITLEQIVDNACAYFGLHQEEIYGKSRKAPIVLARQVSMYLAQQYTKMTASKIGIQIGNRNHATVLHSVRTIEQKMKTDATLKKSVDELIQKLKER